MQCPNCHSQYEKDDTYCQQCGEDLVLSPTSIVTTTQTRLPARQQTQVPRRVAASVGAVALGVGIELLRRNLLTRFTATASRSVGQTVPALTGLKDVLQAGRTFKAPKGYVIDETIVYTYTHRVIRREQ